MIEGDDQREAAGSSESQASWFGHEDGPRRQAGGCFAGIVVNRPIDQVLTYRVGPVLGQTIRPGQRVRVPLGRGNRLTTGYCVSVEMSPPDGLDSTRLKEVVEVLDPLPLIDAKMLELTRW